MTANISGYTVYSTLLPLCYSDHNNYRNVDYAWAMLASSTGLQERKEGLLLTVHDDVIFFPEPYTRYPDLSKVRITCFSQNLTKVSACASSRYQAHSVGVGTRLGQCTCQVKLLTMIKVLFKQQLHIITTTTSPCTNEDIWQRLYYLGVHIILYML